MFQRNMIDIEDIKNQVLHNCAVSDSRHVGLYSICGLAMRLRDLYKWEKGLAPWIEKDSRDILTWIGDKEGIWEQLAGEGCQDIAKKYSVVALPTLLLVDREGKIVAVSHKMADLTGKVTQLLDKSEEG